MTRWVTAAVLRLVRRLDLTSPLRSLLRLTASDLDSLTMVTILMLEARSNWLITTDVFKECIVPTLKALRCILVWNVSLLVEQSGQPTATSSCTSSQCLTHPAEWPLRRVATYAASARFRRQPSGVLLDSFPHPLQPHHCHGAECAGA